ncbi:hypothetical protein Goarm_004654 [Gossypium armourianum]|uniref:Uncharacterized protein n=1 Tax=Gossypium armourianum TaxID=34283 RepID=A0A7J9JXI3_9ROSI|nr:hypothetical protein [Gossypium armourianum]
MPFKVWSSKYRYFFSKAGALSLFSTDERTTKAAEFEQKLALLEVECASLNQELQNLEARARRGQKKSPEEANQMVQMQAWQEEVERARRGQRDAESKLSLLEASIKKMFSSFLYCKIIVRLFWFLCWLIFGFVFFDHFSWLQAELQKMRVEMAAMKRDAEHYSRQEHMELEKRYRELTDLLVIETEVYFFTCSCKTYLFGLTSWGYTIMQYNKQTQLETMASEKAAAEFQLEKEIKRLQEAQVEVERSRVPRRASMSWEEDTEIKALEYVKLFVLLDYNP